MRICKRIPSRCALAIKLRKGQFLGKLGNSGNTSGPHLHFHIMTGPSVLGSNGVPYVIDSFNLAGQIDTAAFEAAPDLTGNWGKGRLSKAERHEREFPLNFNIIDFPSAPNSR
jgi:murein DD-endopeptidase MepM/ murein hydrolase activator NlpD